MLFYVWLTVLSRSGSVGIGIGKKYIGTTYGAKTLCGSETWTLIKAEKNYQ